MIKKKIILYGAIARHNFGDLIFAHVVERIIKDAALDAELIFCDLVDQDMSLYGGHNVKSIGQYIDVEELSIIFIGGETAHCRIEKAYKMLGAPNQSKLGDNQLAYVFSKSQFKKPAHFILNSAGGYSIPAAKALETFDYISCRDKVSAQKFSQILSQNLSKKVKFIPDCAVLTRKYFDPLIKQREASIEYQTLTQKIGNDFIAVQINQNILVARGRMLKSSLERVIKESKLPIVFFCAGVAPHHDSIELYNRVFKDLLTSGNAAVFNDLNIWGICHLISKSNLVVGTSLHVRIISSLYEKKRTTIVHEPKHVGFINDWDYLKEKTIPKNIFGDVMNLLNTEHDLQKDRENTSVLENHYLDNCFIDTLRPTHKHTSSQLGSE